MSDQLEYLTIGRILKPWGVVGQVKVEILTDRPQRFKNLTRVFVGPEAHELQIERVHFHSGAVLLKFVGFDTPEAVARFRLQELRVPITEAVKLKKGEYYHHQIVGLVAKTETGETLGTITNILVTGANDVYVVTTAEGRELLLPAIRQVILKIDVESGEMIVRMMPGLEAT